MGRAKDDWIERTGGFRIGESPEQFQQRAQKIDAVTKKLTSGTLSSRQVERTLEQLNALRGTSLPDEFRTHEEEFGEDD